jgi:hypothetical protein
MKSYSPQRKLKSRGPDTPQISGGPHKDRLAFTGAPANIMISVYIKSLSKRLLPVANSYRSRSTIRNDVLAQVAYFKYGMLWRVFDLK